MAKLYFFYSAMNAGKSTHLLQSAYNYEQRGMRVLLFLPSIDGRAGEGVISSRIGLSRSARSVDPSSDLYRIVDEVGHEEGFDAVFVDEAHCLAPNLKLD